MIPRIDTLAISKRLTDGGFTREQADVLSATWNEAIDMAVRDLATTQDIAATREEIKRLAERFAAEQKAALAEQKTAIAEAMNRQIAWTIGTIVAVMGAGIAIARFF
jgi:hypothetical protein